MIEVTKEEFYREIQEKKLNVSVKCVGEEWPYTEIFSFPDGREWGRIVPIQQDGIHPHFWEERYLIK